MAIHKKTGNFYSVIGVAHNVTNGHESDEMLVVYCRDGKLFASNVSEFKEKFEKIEIWSTESNINSAMVSIGNAAYRNRRKMMPRLPEAHYRCHACNDIEVFHLSQHLRRVGETFICEDCYYDGLAAQGGWTLTHSPDFKIFPTLSKIMKGKP